MNQLNKLTKVLNAREARQEEHNQKIWRELEQLGGKVDALSRGQNNIMSLNLSNELSRHETVFERDLIRKSLSLPSGFDTEKFGIFIDRYRPYTQDISNLLYERLSTDDQQTFLKWILVRFLKLTALAPGELDSYVADLAAARSLTAVGGDRAVKLPQRLNDMRSVGFDLDFMCDSEWVLVNDFYRRQYHHPNVHPVPGDIIVDAGSFLGDSAVVFAHDVDYDCEIHSFDISEDTIKLFQMNLDLNPRIREVTSISRIALSAKTGEDLVYDSSPSDSSTFKVGQLADASTAVTVPGMALDDYVDEREVPRIDFIKMDIEGGEREALMGAMKVLSTYKPRLAIAIYHLWDDIFVLPKLILQANPRYKFGFKWTNLKIGNEAVLFAYDPGVNSSL